MTVANHRILYVIPNLQQGGAERQILELMTKLPARFAPMLCLWESVVHYRDYLPPGQPQHVLGVHEMQRRDLDRLVEIMRREQPTIVHSYRDKANYWTRMAAHQAGVPIVITGVRCRALALRNLLTEWYHARWCDRVLANSEGVRRELVERARVPAEKIRVIHNFIDLKKFQPPDEAQRAAARVRFGLEPEDIALLVPGRISLQKHQVGLAVALALLARRGGLSPRVRVLLAGRERDRFYAALFPRVARLLGVASSLVRLGTVTDMPELYHAADALVLPSLWEGLPNVVLEAAASGLPAVVSHSANIDRLVLNGESGFEVPTFNHSALADALGRIIAMTPEQRRSMGARGRAHVALRFDPARVMAEMVALYDGLLREKGLA